MTGILVYGAYQSMGRQSLQSTKPMGLRVAAQFMIATAGIGYFVYYSVSHGGIKNWITGKTTGDIQRQLAVNPKKTTKETPQ